MPVYAMHRVASRQARHGAIPQSRSSAEVPRQMSDDFDFQEDEAQECYENCAQLRRVCGSVRTRLRHGLCAFLPNTPIFATAKRYTARTDGRRDTARAR